MDLTYLKLKYLDFDDAGSSMEAPGELTKLTWFPARLIIYI